MFRGVQRFVRWAYGDVGLPTPEEWARYNANKCSADDIIAAAVVQSFAKHFEDWKSSGRWINSWTYDDYRTCPRLVNEKAGIEVRQDVGEDRQGYDASYFDKGLYVNGVKVSKKQASFIRFNWIKMATQVEATKKAAADAKAEMERNETAWNLAEKLLGMKRNEFGALVPAKTVEE